MKSRAVRLSWAIFVLFLSSPCWALALVLVPVYFVERACYHQVLRSFEGLRRASTVVEFVNSPLSSRVRYFAKSRNARRAHKAVRP